jgi:RNA polymerase sigma factor (sigma-70 family)
MDKTVEKMIEDNKKLVYKIANSIYIKNKLFSKEDLIQVGFLALCKSGHKYDETRGKISTFITHCVRNDILKFIKSQKQQSELLYADNNSFTYHDNEFAYTDYYDLVNAKTELEKQIVDLKINGNTNKSISTQLKISPNKVSKILTTLKSRMDKQNNG